MDLALAFDVNERMRARALHELLSRQDPQAPGPERGLVERRQQVLRGIARVQSRLLHPELDADGRRAALRELDALELDEARLQAAIAPGLVPAGAALGLASLESTRRALRRDEALLSFIVGLDRHSTGSSAVAAGCWS